MVLLFALSAVACAPADGISGAGTDGTGRVMGLFVGIEDYGFGGPRLTGAATDVTEIHQTLASRHLADLRDNVSLTNGLATFEEVERQMTELGSRVTPMDVFLFIFSGHAQDGSCALWGDRPLRVADLDRLLDRVNGANRVLVVIDVCHAASFRSVIYGNRVGIFSSRADETSANTDLGGHLMNGLNMAIRVLDQDGVVSLGDLDRQINAHYRSMGVDQRQHLVVEGEPSTVLWHRLPFDQAPVGQ